MHIQLSTGGLHCHLQTLISSSLAKFSAGHCLRLFCFLQFDHGFAAGQKQHNDNTSTHNFTDYNMRTAALFCVSYVYK